MLWWLTQTTLVAAILAGLIALACRFGRLGPAVRHALWLVVLVKLVTPPLVSWPWPAPDLFNRVFPEPSAQVGAANGRDSPVAPGGKDSASSLWQAKVADDLPIEAAKPPDWPGAAEHKELNNPPPDLASAEGPLVPGPLETPPSEYKDTGSSRGNDFMTRSDQLARMGLSAWLTAVAAFGLWQLVRVFRVRGRIALGQPAANWLVGQLEELAAQLHVKAPAVVVLEGLASPCLWILGRPKLLWPKSLSESLSADRLRAVLVHELAHLQRRDHWVGWLQLLAGCLWWWNPLFWYVRNQLRANAELACDAWVLSVLPEARRAYAETLIEVSQMVSRTALPTPALGMGSCRRDFERRLTMIMCEQVPCKVSRRAFLAIGALAMIGLPGWSLAQQVIEKADKSDTVQAQQPAELIKGGKESRVGKETDPNKAKSKVQANRDRRLEALEKQLQALLKEVRALRSGSTHTQQHLKIKNYDVQQAHVPLSAQTHLSVYITELAKASRDSVQVITLARATYKLPMRQARELSDFLQKNLGVEPLEIKVNNDSITILTTPEAQKTLGQFIHMLRPPPKASEDKK